jgi:predicted dehydrogenase
MPSSSPRIAVVGCGAIARSFHLPALVRHADVARRLIVVDRDADRARSVAAEFGVTRTATSCADILPEVDGVIVTVPHTLHYQISMECLRAGKHVLCEKPLAESPQEAVEMVAAAANAGVTLSANHIRRLHPTTQRIHEMVREGAIGNLSEINFSWGEKFDWPAASGFYFGIGGKPHGVLFDKGPHALDLICWWLGGKPDVISCHDDSFGGGEAMVSLRLALNGCTIRCEFSFLSRYPNTYSLVGDAGRIDGTLFDINSLMLTSRQGVRRKISLPSPVKSAADFSRIMIDNFLDVVGGTARPLVPASEVLDSVVLIDECYAKRARYVMPWHDTWQRIAHV